MLSLIAEYLIRFINIISPKACVICGNRLAIGEDVICSVCNIHLPRTGFSKQPYDNKMARNFWGHIKIERAAALFYYDPHSEVSRIILSLKYLNHPETGEIMGKMLAEEFIHNGFFEGIDVIVPVPLTRKRQHLRGYNQSFEIAYGISKATKIPILNNVIKRKSFKKSQTKMNRWQRMDNVRGEFFLKRKNCLVNKHVLIVDDVVTTGATVISCANELSKCGGVKFSVLSLGFTR